MPSGPSTPPSHASTTMSTEARRRIVVRYHPKGLVKASDTRHSARAMWDRSLAILCLLCACDSTLSIEPAPELTPFTEMLAAPPVHFGVPVADGRVLVDDARGLLLVRDAMDEGTRVGEPNELGDLVSVTRVDDTTLIVGTSGAYSLRGDELFASPIRSVLGDVAIRSIVATPREDSTVSDLWVLAGDALYLYRDGELRPIQIPDVAFTEAIIATAPIRLRRGVWVSAEDRMFELLMKGDDLIASEIVEAVDAVDMTSDGSGLLWIVANGTLYALGLDRVLVEYELPFEPTALHATSGSGDLYIETTSGLWHAMNGEFRPVAGIEADAQLAPGIDGEIFATSTAGLTRVRSRHRVRVLGLEAGERLVGPTTIEIDVPFADRSTGVEASIGSDPMTVLDAPLRVEVDPTSLSIGAHELVVTVRYGDGTLPVVLRIPFQVGLDANWNEDVRPIFEARCAMCHGEGGSAPTRLDSKTAWQANIETILFNVRERRMPLGQMPLEADTIALIEAWSAAGFPD
jgi:hypothetical protein